MSCGVKRQFCTALREVLDQTPQMESPGKANRSLYEYGVTRRLAAFRMVKMVHPTNLNRPLCRVKIMLNGWLTRARLLEQKGPGMAGAKVFGAVALPSLG